MAKCWQRSSQSACTYIEVTCTSGKGRVLASMVIPHALVAYVSEIKVMSAPWKPHRALTFDICMPSHKLLESSAAAMGTDLEYTLQAAKAFEHM